MESALIRGRWESSRVAYQIFFPVWFFQNIPKQCWRVIFYTHNVGDASLGCVAGMWLVLKKFFRAPQIGFFKPQPRSYGQRFYHEAH